jgi:hypothetical protein
VNIRPTVQGVNSVNKQPKPDIESESDRSRNRSRRRNSSTFPKKKKNNLKDHQSAQRGETDASSHGERSPVHILLCARRRKRVKTSKAASKLVAHPSLTLNPIVEWLQVPGLQF